MIDKNIRSMIIGAILISFSPILVKAIQLSPTAIAFYRFLIGTLTLGLFLLIKRKTLKWSAFKVALPFMALSGLFFSLDLWVWHRSIFYIGAGLGTVLANTQVFYLTLIGYLFFKEKPKAIFYLGASISILGICFVSKPLVDFSIINNATFGVFFALLTGLAYALMNTFLKKAAAKFEENSPLPIFGMSLFATVFSFILFAAEQNYQLPQKMDWLYILTYGAAIHFIGWLLISKAINNIPLALTGLILLIQPILATIMGGLIFNEKLSFYQVFGLVLSLFGIYLATLGRRNKNEKKC